MRVLLIGGTGVLSSAVMHRSLQKEHDVFILNRGHNAKSIPPDVSLLQADIRHTDDVNHILQDLSFDVVVDFLSYNVSDLENSLSIFQDRCNQFIFISSACVYRRARSDGCITEDSPFGNHNWDYSANKVRCEEYLISKCSKTGLKYTIVRPYITYGNTRVPYGIMPPYGWHWTLIARLLNNKPIMLWDKGDAICTLTHTSDFAKGVVGLFGNIQAYNEAFHIVGDERLTWKELLLLIGTLVDIQATYVTMPSAYVATRMPGLKGMLLEDRSLDAVFDSSKIKNAVPEFVCATPLEKGIAQTLEYYRNNSYINGIDYRWDAQMDKLIQDYLKENNPDKLKGLDLGFVDYLQGSFSDKLVYSAYRYLPNPFIRAYESFGRVIRRLGS